MLTCKLVGSLPLLGFARDASLAQYMQMKRKCKEEQRGLRLQKVGNLESGRQHHWKDEKESLGLARTGSGGQDHVRRRPCCWTSTYPRLYPGKRPSRRLDHGALEG